MERRPAVQALFPGAAIVPDHPCPVPGGVPDQDAAAADLLRGHLECRGPSSVADLSEATGLPEPIVIRGLARLEAEGFAIRGEFTAPGAEEYCARRLLARIHVYTRQRLRREIEPVSAQDFMRFLLRWQHVAAGTRREGRFGVLAVIEQLQGFETAAGVWESAVLASRVEGYRRDWLDELCLSGQVAWGRLTVRDAQADAGQAPAQGASDGQPEPHPQLNGQPGTDTRRSGLTPSRATPITLTIRDDLPWLLAAARGDLQPAEPGPGRTRDILDALARHGALFRPDLASVTGRLPYEVEEALWDGVARGLVTADGFRAVRSLLRRGGRDHAFGRRGLRRGLRGSGSSAAGGRLGRPVVAAARPRRRTGPRRASGGDRRAASGPLGRHLPRSGRPRAPGRPVARDPLGAAPDGSPRHRPRRPVRDRLQRRAVRAPRRRRGAPHRPQDAAQRRDGHASPPPTRSTSPASSSPAPGSPPSARIPSPTPTAPSPPARRPGP